MSPFRPVPGNKVHPSDPSVPLVTVAMRRVDKERFDVLQNWLSIQERRRVRQWEVLRFLVEDAWAGPVGGLVAADAAPEARPKPKRL